MKKIEIISKSSLETLKIAKKLASLLSKGDIVVLTGELGSGKTKFVEGFLQKFNLQNEISSPTFNIVNEYINGENKIYHFDVYRLEEPDEFYEFGGEEYFEKGICLIEWGEIINSILPHDYIHIKINKHNNDENTRIIQFIVNDNSKYEEVLNEIIKY